VGNERANLAGVGVMIPKAQAGISSALAAEFSQTALNPVILDTAGTMLIMTQLPWFEQLAPSPKHLKHIWPTLNKSTQVFTKFSAEQAAKVTKLCDAGALGNASAAEHCFNTWQHELVPPYVLPCRPLLLFLLEVGSVAYATRHCGNGSDLKWLQVPSQDGHGAADFRRCAAQHRRCRKTVLWIVRPHDWPGCHFQEGFFAEFWLKSLVQFGIAFPGSPTCSCFSFCRWLAEVGGHRRMRATDGPYQ
jgi:hypothetical protein